jgi:YbbR domain-containing protein
LKKYLASLKKNKGLKLLAFLLALAAWFAVGTEERTETTLQMALELRNIPKNLMVTNEIPSQLEVRVQGPRSVIRELTDDKLHKQVDLSRAKAGTYTELLTPNSLNFPRGVVVTRIRPSALSIALDQALIRRVEVQPVIKGSPAPGFEIGEIVVNPKEALVRGPNRDMNQLKFINTIPIDINKLSSSCTRDIELDFQNLSLTYLDNQPLIAKINIKPKLQTKTFNNIIVVPNGATGPLSLDPTKVSITIRGPVTNLELLRTEDLSARINLKNLKAGRYLARVAVDLPNGLELVKVFPEKLKVHIRKSSTSHG